jgi:predicted phage terminase large subunit-like protein
MDPSQESQNKSCSKCQAIKPPNKFYSGHDECKSCTRQAIAIRDLDEKAAEHVKKKMLKEEVKKLAKKEIQKKREVKRKIAHAKLIPVVEKGPEVEADQVVIELAKRTLGRRRLIEFVKQFHPRYQAGWVHHDICKRLEKFAADVEAGLSPRLMLLMPPRHGKSQLASKLYPAWHLGHYPHHEFIGCSYNISLALDFSREIRDVIESKQYDTLFPGTKINTEFRSAEAWRLKSSTGVGAGGYNAAGVGGGITGKGAHVLVIDDPVKNAEEAESPDIRQKIWDWYRSTAYTRLAPGGGVLIIQTWWHDDDLAGRVQKEMVEDPDADQFEIVKYPAIAEEDEEFRAKGDPLHEARYNLNALLRIKRTLGDRYWSALYQQAPVSEEGAYFTKDMFIYRNETPNEADMDIYQAWDFAISDKQQKANNWTVGITIGLDCHDMAHVLEVVRLKTNDSAEIADAMLTMYANYKRVTCFGGEDGQIWRAMKSVLKRRMVDRQIYIPLEEKNPLKPITDKMVRARPLQARMQNKKVTFPRGKAWVDDLMKEFLRFPAGVQDDQIDAAAWCVQLLLGRSPPAPPRRPKNKLEKTVEEQLQAFGRTSGARNHMLA